MSGGRLEIFLNVMASHIEMNSEIRYRPPVTTASRKTTSENSCTKDCPSGSNVDHWLD